MCLFLFYAFMKETTSAALPRFPEYPCGVYPRPAELPKLRQSLHCKSVPTPPGQLKKKLDQAAFIYALKANVLNKIRNIIIDLLVTAICNDILELLW